MSEEVKKILELKEDCDYKRISVDEILVLRDYIQELEKYIDDDMKIRKGLIDRIQRQQERIDKAIEYIKNKWKEEKYYHDIENCLEFCEFDKDDLLDILQGGDVNDR